MRRKTTICATAILAMLVMSSPAFAQGVDFTFFLGRAYPVYDDRLTLRAPIPSLPGVEITGDTLEISTDGGLVFGGAVGFELGEAVLDGAAGDLELLRERRNGYPGVVAEEGDELSVDVVHAGCLRVDFDQSASQL